MNNSILEKNNVKPDDTGDTESVISNASNSPAATDLKRKREQDWQWLKKKKSAKEKLARYKQMLARQKELLLEHNYLLEASRREWSQHKRQTAQTEEVLASSIPVGKVSGGQVILGPIKPITRSMMVRTDGQARDSGEVLALAKRMQTLVTQHTAQGNMVTLTQVFEKAAQVQLLSDLCHNKAIVPVTVDVRELERLWIVSWETVMTKWIDILGR